MKRLRYEWDIEEIDEHGDINDHHHRDKLSEFFELGFADDFAAALKGEGYQLVLVRDTLDSDGAVDLRSWAYVEDGKLPVFSGDGFGRCAAKVPQRFHRELAAAIKRTGGAK